MGITFIEDIFEADPIYYLMIKNINIPACLLQCCYVLYQPVYGQTDSAYVYLYNQYPKQVHVQVYVDYKSKPFSLNIHIFAMSSFHLFFMYHYCDNLK